MHTNAITWLCAGLAILCVAFPQYLDTLAFIGIVVIQLGISDLAERVAKLEERHREPPPPQT